LESTLSYPYHNNNKNVTFYVSLTYQIFVVL
jgi:hypothetical protein